MLKTYSEPIPRLFSTYLKPISDQLSSIEWQDLLWTSLPLPEKGNMASIREQPENQGKNA